MRKAWKFSLYVFLLLCLCVLFTSCATKPKTEYINVTETEIQTITETEYVPVYTDLNDTIKTVIEQRPDNSQYVVRAKDQVKTTWDLMANSWAYECAWLDWQAYAELLEDTLYICRDKCADPATLTAETATPEDAEAVEPVVEENATTETQSAIPAIG